MRAFFVLFLIAVSLLSACKRGKVLQKPVTIQLICSNVSNVYPSQAFAPFDPYDPYEPMHYPQYVGSNTSASIESMFQQDLTEFLYQNNIFLVDTVCSYQLVITDIDVSEGLNRESYIDSCSVGYPTRYVYYSDLEVVGHDQNESESESE